MLAYVIYHAESKHIPQQRMSGMLVLLSSVPLYWYCDDESDFLCLQSILQVWVLQHHVQHLFTWTQLLPAHETLHTLVMVNNWCLIVQWWMELPYNGLLSLASNVMTPSPLRQVMMKDKEKQEIQMKVYFNPTWFPLRQILQTHTSPQTLHSLHVHLWTV